MTIMAVEQIVALGHDQIQVHVVCGREDHVFLVVESADQLSDAQRSLVTRQTAKCLPDGPNYYKSSDAISRPFVEVFLAIGTHHVCCMTALTLAMELCSMANRPSHT